MAIHIAVAILFLLPNQIKESRSVPVTINFTSVAKEKKSAVKGEKIQIKDLLPKYSLGTRAKGSQTNLLSSTGLINGTGGPDSEEIPAFTAPIQTLEDAIDLDPFYQSLWIKLATTAQYPEDFSKHYIQGSVTVRMEVDFRGVMTKRKLYVESTNPYLETLALYTVISALKQPLDSKVWIAKTKVPVTIHLNYIHRMPDDPRGLSPGSIAGHHIEVSKYDYIQPEYMKKIDDFMLTYFPPVVPIPGGFYIDFVRAYEMIKRIQEPDQNEMRSYRAEALEDSLERLIQKEQNPDEG